MATKEPQASGYSRQFIAGPRFVPVDGLHEKATFADRLYISRHRNLLLTRATVGQREVASLGCIIDPRHPERGNIDIVQDLAQQSDSFCALEHNLARLGGRWVVFARIDNELRLYPDAAGSRSVFFTVVPDDGLWIASQPNILGDALNLPRDNVIDSKFNSFPRADSWPGALTPFPATRQLLPNTFLDLVGWNTRRFWPMGKLVQHSIEEAASTIGSLLHGTIEAALRRGSVALPLTGGYDSRTLFAAAKELRRRMAFFVISDPAVSRNDIAISRKLARLFDVTLSIVKTRTYDASVAGVLDRNVAGMWQDPGEKRVYTFGAIAADLILLGHVSEVLRCFYYSDGQHPAAIGPAQLASIARYANNPLAIEAFAQWLASVPEDIDINLLDLFYWEHRLGNWSSMCCTAIDSVADTISPYNCRQLLEIGLGVDVRGRARPYELHRQICQWGAARSLDLLFNSSPYDKVLEMVTRLVPWRIRQAYHRFRMRLAGLAD